MTKLELITKMVEESKIFTAGKETHESSVPKYVQAVSKYIHKELDGIALTTSECKTHTQVYNKYVDDGVWSIKRKIDAKPYKYCGAVYKGDDKIIEIKLEREIR